jgi:hypothetical protein
MTTLISNNTYGELHKLDKPYVIILKNTYTPFGIQTSFNKRIIHWYIKSIDDIKLIRHFQEDLQNNILKDANLIINTKITQKDNYPPIIETNINTNLDSDECISHDTGEIVTYNCITKKTRADVLISCDTIVLMKNKVNMIWNIDKIVRYPDIKKCQSL